MIGARRWSWILLMSLTPGQSGQVGIGSRNTNEVDSVSMKHRKSTRPRAQFLGRHSWRTEVESVNPAQHSGFIPESVLAGKGTLIHLPGSYTVTDLIPAP